MASKSYDKLIEEIGNLSVIELSQLVKALEEKFGVSAAMPVGVAQATTSSASAAAPQEEKTSFKVVLQDGGPEKIKTIKALREVVSSLGLAEAKKSVEEAPTVIGESVAKADAMKIKEKLESVGAKGAAVLIFDKYKV